MPEGPLADDHLPFCRGQRAGQPAVRTRGGAAQSVGLLLGGGFEGAGQQATDGGAGDFFHLGEVDLQAGTAIAAVLWDDDLAPLVGQFGDTLPVGRGEFGRSQVASRGGVANHSDDELQV